MESSKWLAAVASIWIQCSSGASYTFGIYSPVLKSTQAYDQSTLDTVSVFKDIGANAGILSGLLYTAVAANPTVNRGRLSFLHGGPWVVHLAGAVQCFAGYFFMWLAVTGIIHRPPVAIMSLFMFIAAHAQTFLNTANVVAAVQNFPDHSGTIVGIMKGFLGLSGAILIQVYQTLSNGNPSSLILMLALLPTIVTLVLMFLVRVHQTPSRNEEKHLHGFLLLSLVIAAYLLLLRILENVFVFPQWATIITFLVLLALLCSPISVAFKAQRVDLERLPPSITSSSSLLIDEPELDSPNKLTVGYLRDYDEVPTESVQHKASSILQPNEQKNLWQAMCTIDFWFLFVAMICGMGSGLATINNISQIGESLGYTTLARSTLVSFWSIWNFLGRLGAGYVSDIFLLRRGWPRPLFMVFTLAAMTVGHVIIASGFPGNLYVGSLLVGICYGSQWSLMPTITKEIFGVVHMGTIFNTISIASPVGSYILSVRVIGYIYDKEVSGEGNSCFGTHCFMLSYFILASVSLFGVLVALALFYRTRRFYSRVLLC
ncbi:protein NUCLEAR FUSION DEFECTIVE 4-like [Nicotiana tomentosiformis]|uniref:protein NUCLEAR FUSION DEFECTIVE 4-like n=1 Tax=Nicotiana tomentosiformis TaxID=4098 RepID=UPI00051C0DC7|nr:protein NUCLEAR FUSION DEFECTIVE 4-like [Nicotiana tomentosiformis]